jgi:AraC-like DNA-binding protein
MILDQFPDLEPKPLTPRNAGFRSWFAQRWRRENLAVLGCAKKIAYPPYRSLLSIKRCWGGAEHYLLEGRRLAVSEDRFLIVNEDAAAGVEIDSPTEVTSLALFFRPAMAQEMKAALLQPLTAALDAETERSRASIEFAPNLRVLTPVLDRELTQLRDAIRQGLDDELWLDERMQEVLAELLRSDLDWRARSRLLQTAARSTHREMLSRVDRAADFMLSCHAQPLTLDDIAAAARLSKYHLVRVFRRVNGTTPVAFLTRQRTRTALRLLGQTSLSLDEIAALSGFGSRQTMFRQLRRARGAGGREIRAHAAAPAIEAAAREAAPLVAA